MIEHLHCNGLLETDLRPPKLSESAAAVVAQRLLNANTTHPHRAKTLSNPPCNQLIVDYVLRDMSPHLPIEHQSRILKCFSEAPLDKLDARRSNVSLDAMFTYLSDPSCARTITSLSFPPVFHDIHNPGDVDFRSGDFEFTKLKHLDVGTRIDTSSISYALCVVVSRCPNLTALTMYGPRNRLPHWNGDTCSLAGLINDVCKSIPYITYLDLSFQALPELDFLPRLRNLTSLILHDFENANENIEVIMSMSFLRILDVSQTDLHQYNLYLNPTVTLDKIVVSLNRLQYLDISGTNLSCEVAAATEQEEDDNVVTDIVGLRSLRSPLKYLGIAFSPAGKASRIPAEKVGGTASKQQILYSLAMHVRRHRMFVGLLENTLSLLRDPHNDTLGFELSDFLVSCIGHIATFLAMFDSFDQLVAASIGDNLHLLLREVDGSAELELPPGLVTRLLQRLTEFLEKNLGAPHVTGPTCGSIAYLLVEGSIPSAIKARLAIATAKLIHGKNHYQDVCIGILQAAVEGASDVAKLEIGASGALRAILRAAVQSDGYRLGNIIKILLSLIDNCPGNAETAIVAYTNDLDQLLYCLTDRAAVTNRAEVTFAAAIFHNISDVPHLRRFLISDKYVWRFLPLLDDFSQVYFDGSFHVAGMLVNLLADTATSSDCNYWNGKVGMPSTYVGDRVLSVIRTWDVNIPLRLECSTFLPLLKLIQCDGHVAGHYYALWTMTNYTNQRSDNGHVASRRLAEREGVLDYLRRSNVTEGGAKWNGDPYITRLALTLLTNLTS